MCSFSRLGWLAASPPLSPAHSINLHSRSVMAPTEMLYMLCVIICCMGCFLFCLMSERLFIFHLGLERWLNYNWEFLFVVRFWQVGPFVALLSAVVLYINTTQVCLDKKRCSLQWVDWKIIWKLVDIKYFSFGFVKNYQLRTNNEESRVEFFYEHCWLYINSF